MVDSPSNLCLVLDPRVEAPTLGGLFNLRMEGELLLSESGLSQLRFHLAGGEPSSGLRKLLEATLNSGRFETLFVSELHAYDRAYPLGKGESQFDGYTSTQRIARLSDASGRRPVLSWNDHLLEGVRGLLAEDSRPLVCLHLRRTPPYARECSNADLDTWSEFLTQATKDTSRRFVLLGDDSPSPDELAVSIPRASDLGLSLDLQCCLAAHAAAFLGMASGLASPALFSMRPYALFKHPAHHAEAMQAELGNTDHLPFAGKNQRILRKDPTVQDLFDALDKLLR